MRGTQGYNYKNILKDKADVADEIKYELNIKLRMKFMFFCIYETFVWVHVSPTVSVKVAQIKINISQNHRIF